MLQTPKTGFFQDRWIRLNLQVSLLFNLASWVVAVWNFRDASEFIPLHSTIYFSIDFIGPRLWLFGIPSLGTLMLISNTLAAGMMYRKERAIAWLVGIATSLLLGLLLWAVYLIGTLELPV